MVGMIRFALVRWNVIFSNSWLLQRCADLSGNINVSKSSDRAATAIEQLEHLRIERTVFSVNAW